MAVWGDCECVYVCLGGSAFRELDGEVARWAAPSVGVMGETGGRTGDADCEFEGEFGEWPCWDRGEVSTVRPGIVLLVGGAGMVRG
jgi:hypothetical protein